MFVLAWEKGIASIKFGQDASKAPHVNCCRIWNTEYDLWRSVEPRLDVCVDALIVHAAATVVNNFYARLVGLLEQNIFWFQIAVDYLVVTLVFQSLQKLDSKSSNQSQAYPLEVVILDELV